MTENIENLNQSQIPKIETTNDFDHPPINQITKKNPIKIIPIVFGCFIIMSVITVGAYYLGTKKSSTNPVSSGATPTEAKIETPLFSGQVQRLNQDLKLFKDIDSGNGSSGNSVYYSAGVFNKGDLKDYTRIIATHQILGPGDASVFILATKDFQTFILNDPDSATTKYPEDNWQNPFNVLNKNKIISTKSFDTEQPREISLDSKFSLYSQNVVTENSPTQQTDQYGNKAYSCVLVSNFSSYQKITSTVKNLTFYFKPNKRSDYFDQMPQSQKGSELVKEKYIAGDTSITVVDSTGLPVSYLLTTNENIKTYQQKSANNDISLKDSMLPGLNYPGSAIENKNNLTFFKIYAVAIPGDCAFSLATKVINISDDDLQQIGSVSGIPVFVLKDKNHPLYKLAFDNKTEYYDVDTKYWDTMNKGIKKPTLQEYINSNPLLFIKDYWQRWVALGEYDIQLPGGCGKPVIYLYPEKTTEVSVKFNTPVQFTTDIPKYNDFWQVLAQPNGTLKNLKSNDCSQIDSTKKGSEYSVQACSKNEYPYLYWAGNIYSQNYPSIDQGWIVEKNNLNQFLNNKLSEIGLNSEEKSDFISYWLPELESKNMPYYKISFLQTAELNSLFPMTINPVPNTVFRIFLDYLPLVQKPDQSPAPQVLNKLIRQGFTFVEWGGLKRY